MKQAIAGVAAAETPVMTVWPSICLYPSGRFLGRLYAIQWPGVYVFRLGNLLAILSIPHALFLFFWRLAPYLGQRYTVTNRRIVVQKGLTAQEDRSVGLDRFDKIELLVRPGQAWFDAGDLVFTRSGVEVFRLEGVSRPEAFRNVCWKSHRAFVGVQQARERQAALA